MSAHIEPGDNMATSGRNSATPRDNLVKLSEAAQALGFHVETLRLRVRRGELAATRGAHGTYFISRSSLNGIEPPKRSQRRKVELSSFGWTWVLLEERAEEVGAGQDGVEAIRALQQDPTLDRHLHVLLSVHRLRLAGLTSIEIAVLLEISARHVRRLVRRILTEALEDAAIDLKSRERSRALRAARRVVIDLQYRLEQTGFHYHRRPWQPNDLFTPRGRRAPAHMAKRLFFEEIIHLHDAGLTDKEISAIQRVGIGQDELHELIMQGLRGQLLPPSVEPTPPMTT